MQFFSLALATVCLPLLGSASPHDPFAAAQPVSVLQGADREAFERDLARIARSVAAAEWSEVESAIPRLLREHAAQPYVLPHLTSLREDLKRAAFWKVTDAPDPRQTVSGSLLRYDRSSGKLRLRYEPDQMEDFEPLTGSVAQFLHPMVFSGPWSLEIEADADRLTGLAVMIWLQDGEVYVVNFGDNVKGAPTYRTHLLSVVTDEGQQRLGNVTPPERSPRKAKVRAKVEVLDDELRVTYQRKRIFEQPRKEGSFGQLGLQFVPGLPWQKLLIDGKVGQGWIDGRIDALVAEERAAFESQWSLPEEFSAWTTNDQPEETDLTAQDIFGRLRFQFLIEEGPAKKWFEQLTAALDKDLSRAALGQVLEEVEKVAGKSVPEEVQAFLRFRTYLKMDLPSRALPYMDGLRVSPGQETDRELMRAILQQEAGQLDGANETLAALLDKGSESSLVYSLSVENLLLLGQHDEARELLRRGRAKLPQSLELLEREEQLVKAAKGPAWERTQTDEGATFHVYHRVPRKVARDTRKVLDSAWQACAKFFGPLPEPFEGPSLCYLFQGEASYLHYIEGVADNSPENTLGIYSPLLKQIVVWNNPDAERLRQTLRHECAHAYLDLLVGHRIPRWLNEGLAEVFAAAWNEEGEFEPGRLHPEHLRAFQASKNLKIPPLEAFLRMDTASFLKDPQAGYSQAWALVHFLRYPTFENAPRLLPRLLEGLQNGLDPQGAVDAALEGIDVELVQRQYIDWLQGVLR